MQGAGRECRAETGGRAARTAGARGPQRRRVPAGGPQPRRLCTRVAPQRLPLGLGASRPVFPVVPKRPVAHGSPPAAFPLTAGPRSLLLRGNLGRTSQHPAQGRSEIKCPLGVAVKRTALMRCDRLLRVSQGLLLLSRSVVSPPSVTPWTTRVGHH